MVGPTSSHASRLIPIKPNANITDSSYKIAVRFGDQVLQAGFTSIPNLVLNHYAELGISPAEMMFTIHMWQFRWTERDPYPSLTTIADKMDVSWRQAHRYANSLKDKGFLNIKSRQEPGRGQVTSEYDFEPLIKAVLEVDKNTGTTEADLKKGQVSVPNDTPLTRMTGGGMTELTEAPLTQMSDEEYIEQEDPSQEDVNPSNIRKAKSLKREGEASDEIGDTIPSPTFAVPAGVSITRKDVTSRGEGFSSLGDALARSNLKLPPRSYGEERQVIMDYVARFAQEFNDHASLRTSTTRAYNLFKRSGVPLGGFIGRMYEAHAITKENASAVVPKRHNSGQAPPAPRGRPPKNRMAYWFSVLEDRLGLRPPKENRGERRGDRSVQKSS
jgi:hypothetical protein